MNIITGIVGVYIIYKKYHRSPDINIFQNLLGFYFFPLIYIILNGNYIIQPLIELYVMNNA